MKHCVFVVQPLRAADSFERILSEIMQLLFKLLFMNSLTLLSYASFAFNFLANYQENLIIVYKG